MKLRPILFSTPMVKAILDETKTQTRRTIKPQPIDNREVDGNFFTGNHSGYVKVDGHPNWRQHFASQFAPWDVGDILWVRETTQILTQIGYVAYRFSDGEVRVWEDERPDYEPGAMIKQDWSTVKKTPSIHVPKRFARLFLKIKTIRVERLLDISPDDAYWEGVNRWDEDFNTEPGSVYASYENYLDNHDWFANPVDSYFSLWDKLNGIDSHKANPWVWVVEFELVPKPDNF